MNICPAHHLEGEILDNGWEVIRKVTKKPNSSGGTFSVCYIVMNSNGHEAFLKALDYNQAKNSFDVPTALNNMTAAYIFERDVLLECRNKKMSKVVTSIESGSFRKVGFDFPADYLIFELADGDIRNFQNISNKFDDAWILRSLHHIAIGLNKIHSSGIAHQDLKPSNVLVFGQNTSKIADFGRAAMKNHISPPHEDCSYAGDRTYAPIELLYGYLSPDWNARRVGCDLYLLGSMIMFFYTKVSTTAAILSEMHRDHHPGNWNGSYADVLPYIRTAFNAVTEKMKDHLHSDYGDEIVSIVQQLCDPEVERRGHPKNRMGSSDQFSLERYVSRFNVLADKAQLHMLEGSFGE